MKNISKTELEGLTIALRKWEISDLPDLVENANNIEIAKYLTSAFPHPYTVEDGRKFIEWARSDNPLHFHAIEIQGKACGCISIFPNKDVHQKSADIGYWVGERYWGNGVMICAIKMILEYGFETWDIERIYARPYGFNLRSQKLLEKIGMTLETVRENGVWKNGRMVDEHIYSIGREEILRTPRSQKSRKLLL